MPSAASVKLDKPPTNNSAVNVAGKEITAADNVDNSSPIRQVIVIIDHKIRNLEKRKVSHCPLIHILQITSQTSTCFNSIFTIPRSPVPGLCTSMFNCLRVMSTKYV